MKWSFKHSAALFTLGLMIISPSVLNLNEVTSAVILSSTEVQDFIAVQIDLDNNDLFDYLELRFDIHAKDQGNLTIDYQFFNEDQELFHVRTALETKLIPIIPGLNSIRTSLSNSILYGLSYQGNLTIKFNGHLNYVDSISENLDPVSFWLAFNYINYELPPVYSSGPLKVTPINLDQNNTLADIINLEIPITSEVNASIDVSTTTWKRIGNELKANIRGIGISFNVTSQTSKINVPFLAQDFLTSKFFDFRANLKILLSDGFEYNIINQYARNISLPDISLDTFGLKLIPSSGTVTEIDSDYNGKIDMLGINYTINTIKAINIYQDYEILNPGGFQIYLGHSNETIRVTESAIQEHSSHEVTAYMSIDGLGSLNSDDTVEILIKWSGSYLNYSHLKAKAGSTTLPYSPSGRDYDSPGTMIINDSITLSYIEPLDSLSEKYDGLAIDFDVYSKYYRPEMQVGIELFVPSLTGSISLFAYTSSIVGTQYLNSDIYHERIEFNQETLSNRWIRRSQLDYEGLMEIHISSSVALRWTDDVSDWFVLEQLIVQIEFSLKREANVLGATSIPIFSSTDEEKDTPQTSFSYSQFESSKKRNSEFGPI